MSINPQNNLEIYVPSDDSYLLNETLKKEIPRILKEKNKDIKVIEVGCGSGIQLQILYETGIKKQNLFSCDINPQAVEKCKKTGFNSVVSDLFSNINKKEKYDIIVFNPPYLPDSEKNPEPKESKLITTGGGKEGSEIINKFLRQSKEYLKKEGIIFLLTSSLTKNIDLSGFNKELVNKKSLFFERLYVWKITRKNI